MINIFQGRLKSITLTKLSVSIFAIVFLILSSITITGYSEESPNILLIDGGGKPVDIPNLDGWDHLVIQNAPDTIIENLIYTDGKTILVVRSDNLLVRNNTIRNAESYALFIEFSNNVEIYNNTIEGGTNDGLISYENDNVIIKDNSVSAVNKNGIFVNGNNVTISSNTVNNIEGTGIFIQSSTNLVVTNNSISNVDWTPIAVDQTSFDSGTYVGNTYNDILLTNDDINPEIENTFTIGNTAQTLPNDLQSSDNANYLFLFNVVGMILMTLIFKDKRSSRETNTR